MIKQKGILVAVLLSLSFLYSGCLSEKSYLVKEETAAITLITSINGAGDNGYNDLILSGALRYYQAHEDVKFSLQHPLDWEDASNLLDSWVESTRESKEGALLLLASSDYKELLTAGTWTLADNQHIVVFECEHDGLPERVSSFRIGRYGASYLSGCMAHESPEAYVVAAMEHDKLMDEAVTGFCDGYRHTSGNEAVVHYLAEDYKGYGMPDEAYRFVDELDEAFVYPLAGGSNNGIYKYSREAKLSFLLVAGMDMDCSDYSTRIPFSVVVHIDEVVYAMLDEWATSRTLPPHTDYTLASDGVIGVDINEYFFDRVWIWRDYYEDSDYWLKVRDKYIEEALEKEREYAGAK